MLELLDPRTITQTNITITTTGHNNTFFNTIVVSVSLWRGVGMVYTFIYRGEPSLLFMYVLSSRLLFDKCRNRITTIQPPVERVLKTGITGYILSYTEHY